MFFFYGEAGFTSSGTSFLVRIIFGLSIILAVPSFSYAASADDPVIMDEIVVTATRTKEKKKDLPMNTQVIDREEIEQSPAVSVGELLIEEGVGDIIKYPGTSTSAGMRGFRTNAVGNELLGNILVLLNGRRSGTGNVAKILTRNVERIEIIRGPASAQYGSAAMGGLINVITRKGEGKPSAAVFGGLGSFNYKEKGVTFSGTAEKLDFSGSYADLSMGDYTTGDGDRYYNTGFDRKTTMDLNLGLEFLPRNTLRLTYQQFDAEEVGNPSYLSQNDKDDHKNTSLESVDIQYAGETENRVYSWQGRYFDGEDKNTYFDPTASNPDGFDDGIPHSDDLDFQGGQSMVSYQPGSSRLSLGFDWIKYETHNDTYNPKRTRYENPAGFLLAGTKLMDETLIFSGGLRYDYYEVKVIEPSGNTEDDSNLSPNIGMAYWVNPYLKFRVNYSQGFVMPSATNLAADYVDWGIHYVGNPDLDPEKTKNYETGLDFAWETLITSLTYFYTDYEDRIEIVSQSGMTRTWENTGAATIHGLEGNLSYDLGYLAKWDFELKPYVSFVYLVEYKDDDTGEDLNYVSKTRASYGIYASDHDRWHTRLNASYYGPQKQEDFESGTFPTPVVEKAGFTVVDLSAGTRVKDFNEYGSLSVSGFIKNLLDKEYEYVIGYPMPGRSYGVEVKYEF